MTVSTAKAKPRTRTPRTKKAKPPTWPVHVDLWHDDVNAIEAVAVAASTDDCRVALQQLHLTCSGGRLTIEATDNYRLHRAVINSTAGDFDALVPAAWLVKALRGVKPAKGTEPQTVSIGESQVTVANDVETRTVTRPIHDYPDMTELLDKYDAADHSPDTEIGCNPKFLAQLLKACDVFGPGDWRSAARFRVAANNTLPMRFTVVDGNRRFLGLLMPLRPTQAS